MKPWALLLAVAASMPLQAADYLIGELVPQAQVQLKAQVEGMVDSYQAQLGQQLSAGETVLHFDVTDAILERDLAKANLQLAQADSQLKSKQLQRLERLTAKQTLSESELEEQLRLVKISQAQLAVERQRLALAQRQLDKHIVLAPFNGSVVERYAEQGQWISVGEPLYLLANTQQMLVKAHLVEQDIAELAVGQMVQVHIPAVSQRYQVPVLRMARAPSLDGSGYLIELEIDNPDGLLRAGYRAELSLLQDDEVEQAGSQ